MAQDNKKAGGSVSNARKIARGGTNEKANFFLNTLLPAARKKRRAKSLLNK